MGVPYKNMERNLIKQFHKYAPRDMSWIEILSGIGLSIAQHHGFADPPYRLDIYPPYVALHFATSSLEEFAADEAVWMVNFGDAHSLLQNAERKELEKYGANIFSMDMLTATI